MRRTRFIMFALILLSFLLSIYFYPQIPENMATHWNASGEVNGYMPKVYGLFLVPVLMILFTALFLFIPRIDPLRKNIDSFKKYYVGFIIILMVFFLIVQVYMILWNVGVLISANILFPILLGGLFFYIGVLLKHSKRNWFIGIRTPWTMSSDYVWDKTHKLGSKLFMISGVIALVGVFFKEYAFYFILIPVICFSIYLIIYSYVVFKRKR